MLLALMQVAATNAQIRGYVDEEIESRQLNKRRGRGGEKDKDKNQMDTKDKTPFVRKNDNNNPTDRNGGRLRPTSNNVNKRMGGGGGRGGGGGMGMGGMGGMGGMSRSREDDDYVVIPPDDDFITIPFLQKVRISVTNLARQQPLSAFFVMAHNAQATPLYSVGLPATPALASLAETGDPQELVNFYSQNAFRGVDRSSIAIEGYPDMRLQGLGETITFDVVISERYPLISFAAMPTNTNDAIVGLSGVEFLEIRTTLLAPAYDAGTEVNNELCAYIPGPACSPESGNLRATEGAEGVVRRHISMLPVASWADPLQLFLFLSQHFFQVYIHPGISGESQNRIHDNNSTTITVVPTDLNPAIYDWRNPMIRVEAILLPAVPDDDFVPFDDFLIIGDDFTQVDNSGF